MDFELVPFRENREINSLRGDLGFSDGLVNIEFELTGNLRGLLWPETRLETAPGDSREYGLWERTCFELFIGSVASRSYYEVNLSPSGSWNCFSFTDVRTGMKESEALTLRSLESTKTDSHAQLHAALNFNQLRSDTLQIGISAVVEMNLKLRYYALSHGNMPDFHARQHHTLRHPKNQ